MLRQVQNIFPRLLRRHSFLSGVSILVSGTALSQLLTILAAPALTRIYKPEDFGLVAIYMAIVSILGSVASGRYEQAIPLPMEDSESLRLTSLSMMCALATSLAAAFVILVFGETIPPLLGASQIETILWIIPLGVLSHAILQTFSLAAIRQKQFPFLASSKILQSISTILVQLLGFPLGGINLAYAVVSGQVIAIANLFLRTRKGQQSAELSWHGIAETAVSYRRFPLFSSWATLLNTTGAQFPPIILAAVFSPGAAGFYLLAQRLLSLPSTLVSRAVGNVYLANSPNALRKGQLADLTLTIYTSLLKVAMLPCLAAFMLSPYVFAVVFGAQWTVSGILAQWLVIMTLAQFVFSPLSTVFGVIGKNKVGLVLQTILFTVRLCTIMVGAVLDNLVACIAIYAAGSTVCYLFFGLQIFRHTGNPYRRLFQPLARELALSMACISPLILLLLTPYPPEITIPAGILLSLVPATAKYFIQFGHRLKP